MKLPFESRENKKDKNDDKQLYTKIDKFEFTIYPNQTDDIEKILNEFDIHYIKISAESYKIGCFHYSVFSPSFITSDLINRLSNVLDTKQRIHVISQDKIESSISDYFSDIYNTYLKEHKKKENIGPIESIISKTDNFLSHKNDVYFMALIATITSFIGLIQNEVAIIIGGMLISPLIGPISSFSLNSILGRKRQIIDSLTFIAKTIISAILISALITFIFSQIITIDITSEIYSRTQVNPLFIIFAVLLGIAGGLSLLTSFAETMTGVAIAVALIPPAAVAGIGVGLFSFNIALFSGLNLLSNLLGILIGFMVTFLAKNISPRKYYEKKIAESVFKKNIVLIGTLAFALGLIELLLMYLKII